MFRTVVYDTGALIAAESGQRRMRTIHRAALEEKIAPTVPSPVLAQAWRGGPQPLLSRLLRPCIVLELDEDTAHAVGTLCAKSGTNDVVDAAVVEAAARYGAGVYTSDPGDISRLAEATDVLVSIEVV